MDPYVELFELLGALARQRYTSGERFYASLGLNHTEGRLLRLLYEQQGEASQDTLSGLIFIDRSNVGRALKKLEAEGYVNRRKEDGDRRTNRVRITEKGIAFVKDATAQSAALARAFFRDLTSDEASLLVDLLGKVAAHED